MTNIFSRWFGRDDRTANSSSPAIPVKFNHIDWLPIYSVHDELLDRQHQDLFAITNRLIDNYEKGAGDSYTAIKELVVFISEHFYTEQLVMMEHRYTNYNRHVNEHEYFIEKVKSFLQRQNDDQRHLLLDMIKFLRDWIFTHTTSSDLKYGLLLQKKLEEPA
jgi:hemerythrin